jgi:hypothetical protein
VAGVFIVATVSAAMRTRGHSPVAGMRHLGVMLVPAMSSLAVGRHHGQLRLLRITWFGRCRGCRAMMMVMVFHVALMWCSVRRRRSVATWATADEVQDQKQQDQADGSKQQV